jgi:hypothetical protein
MGKVRTEITFGSKINYSDKKWIPVRYKLGGFKEFININGIDYHRLDLIYSHYNKNVNIYHRLKRVNNGKSKRI